MNDPVICFLYFIPFRKKHNNMRHPVVHKSVLESASVLDERTVKSAIVLHSSTLKCTIVLRRIYFILYSWCNPDRIVQIFFSVLSSISELGPFLIWKLFENSKFDSMFCSKQIFETLFQLLCSKNLHVQISTTVKIRKLKRSKVDFS